MATDNSFYNIQSGEVTTLVVEETIGNESEGRVGQGRQDETGVRRNGDLSHYTNRLLGAPHQLLDSVDKRFKSVNEHVGTEYMRQFLMHSPILHIRPGRPNYTGAETTTDITSLLQRVMQVRNAPENAGYLTIGQTVGHWAAKKLIYSNGEKLQKRMFGFRETYVEYMNYVNYMCRSIAILMGLADVVQGEGANIKPAEDPLSFPYGTFVTQAGGGGLVFEPFDTIHWQNYRMSTSHYVKTERERLWQMKDAAADARYNNVKSVQFMVEPVSFSETLSNETRESFIEQLTDGLTHSLGSEIAFMTNSNIDPSIADGLMKTIGSVGDAGLDVVKRMVEPLSGGFMMSLFDGAMRSVQGQKMIYPDIYKSSKSTMDYEFSITLTSPYGDAYNYYMNIVVPLMHLIALAAPKMTTSNTVAAPFLVQAYIPGMCTCQLGIVNQMSIVKNPKMNHVSITGYPLTVQVKFQIRELYNAMAISPGDNPTSFMFNETLNDYMANMAGLIPSVDTYQLQQKAMFQNMTAYYTEGTWLDRAIRPFLGHAEDLFSRVGTR